MKEFEIIICSGKGKLSKHIKRFNKLLGVKGEAAEASHVAVKYEESDFRIVFESTTMNKWADKSGVQKNNFIEWLRNYDGDVYSRKIILDTEMPDTATMKYTESRLGTKYEHGIPGFWELLLCGLRMHKIRSTGRVHCTEEVVLLLQHFGLFGSSKLPNNFPPYTFWSGGDFEKHLLNCTISGTMQIKTG